MMQELSLIDLMNLEFIICLPDSERDNYIRNLPSFEYQYVYHLVETFFAMKNQVVMKIYRDLVQ